jgi:hypothetical protein
MSKEESFAHSLKKMEFNFTRVPIFHDSCNSLKNLMPKNNTMFRVTKLSSAFLGLGNNVESMVEF